MTQLPIQITYTVPEQFIHGRKPTPSALQRMSTTIHSALAQVKLRALGGNVDRTERFVTDAYNENYSISNHDWYRGLFDIRQPRLEEDTVVEGNALMYFSVHTQIRSHILDQLDCRSVLDVGSGRGDNIVALASFNPRLEKVIGLELTEEGYKRSLEWGEDQKKYNMDLIGLGNTIEVDFKKIQFVHGSAKSMPLPDKCVDASYTHLVLEQISDAYPEVLAEMRRVTRKYCIFVESFRESLSLADKLDLKNRDYFRFSYKTFKEYGLEPVFFTTSFLRKTKFGTGLLVARVL